MIQLMLVLVSATLGPVTMPVAPPLDGGGPDAYGYTWIDSDTTAPGAPVFQWQSIRTIGTRITGLGDDNVVGPFPLGFDFPYYWYRVNSVYVGSNGYVAFGDRTLYAASFRQLPDAPRPNNVLAAYMADLDFSALGSPAKAFHWTSADNDTFIVEYDSVPVWNSAGSYKTFQIILSRPDSSITYQYLLRRGPRNPSGNLSIGIENVTGSVGLSYLFNSVPVRDTIHDSLAVRFYPPATSSMIVHDLATWRVMNEENGGVFLLNGTPNRFWAKIKNAGNQSESSIPVYCYVKDLTGTVVYHDTQTIATSSPGQIDSIAFDPAWTPAVNGVYTLTVIADLTGDIFRGNDTIPVETRVVTYPAELSYDRGVAHQAMYWNGNYGGFGNRFVPSSYPVQIEGIRANLTSSTAIQCTMWLLAEAPGGGPGTVLGAGEITVEGSSIWYQTDFSPPVTITSGAFFVGVTSHALEAPSYSMDTSKPISRQSWEFTGLWAPNRDLENQDPMMRALVRTPLAKDLGVKAIRSPGLVMTPSGSTEPVVVVKNSGTNPQSQIPVYCWIDSGATRVYNHCDTVTGPLAAYDTIRLTFPTWTAGPVGTMYQVTVFTALTGDLYPGNDTARQPTSTFIIRDRLVATWKQVAMTMDGDIQTAEWNDAMKWDISDVMGQGGTAVPPGSAILYCKHDSDFVYYAVDLPFVATRNSGDQIGPYVDEDFNHAWAAGDSEGNHWFFVRNNLDSATYRALPSLNVLRTDSFAGRSASSLTSGRLQFEARVRKGTQKWYYNLAPNQDTVGLFTFAQATGVRRGHWPATMYATSFDDPMAYGRLILAGKAALAADVGCAQIVAPTGSIGQNRVVAPKAAISNYGLNDAVVDVRLTIEDAAHTAVYDTTETGILLPGMDQIERTFTKTWTAGTGGNYTIAAYTIYGPDLNHANDTAHGACTVILPAWTQQADVPIGTKNKKVKDGACLTYCEEHDSDYVYLLKGNNRAEFYKYNSEANAWAAKESIPPIGRAGKKKMVKKGATLAQCTYTHKLYATKGNNTVEFWEYDPNAIGVYPWTQKADVPTGAKNVKEGTGAVAVQIGDTNYIYFLKGSGTQEFYRYNTVANAWESKASAPTGLSGKPFKNGSALALTEDGKTIFAVKGSYNEFFRYSVDSNVWLTKTSLPLIGSSGKKKKVKDGAGMAFHAGTVYALKGGNTQEFWNYVADSDKWAQGPDVPLGAGKKVKGGGALVYVASVNALYATKGNNTLEFYKFALASFARAAPGANPNVTGSAAPLVAYDLVASPNPFTGVLNVAYALPRSAVVSLKLYDVTGSLVTVLAQGYARAGRYSARIDGARLAHGIYLLKYEAGSYRTTRKLILE
jgi:hypothetical protein